MNNKKRRQEWAAREVYDFVRAVAEGVYREPSAPVRLTRGEIEVTDLDLDLAPTPAPTPWVLGPQEVC